MTQVSYIHGFGASAGVPANEWSDRSKGVKPAKMLNYTGMTAGEVKLALLHEQLSIFAQYYPENREYQAAITRLENILHAGIHSLGAVSADGYSAIMRLVNKVAAGARQQTRPVGFLVPKPGTPNNAAQAYLSGAGIGDPLIPFNCDDYIAYEWTPTGDQIVYPQGQWAYDQCQKQQEYVDLLNAHLEKSAHHLLYTYVKNPSAQPPTVAAKYVNHSGAIASLSSIVNLPNDSMKLWLRNGVIRNNVTVGAPPEQPEDTYQALKIHWMQQGETIQGFQALLPVILQIVGAIITAIGATKALVDSLRQADKTRLENTAKSIGTAPFGPQDIDFAGWTESSAENNTLGTNKLITTGLLLGGGLLAYNLLK